MSLYKTNFHGILENSLEGVVKKQGNCEIMLPQINMYPRSPRSLNPFPILKVKVQKNKFKTVNRIGVKSIGTVGGP